MALMVEVSGDDGDEAIRGVEGGAASLACSGDGAGLAGDHRVLLELMRRDGDVPVLAGVEGSSRLAPTSVVEVRKTPAP